MRFRRTWHQTADPQPERPLGRPDPLRVCGRRPDQQRRPLRPVSRCVGGRVDSNGLDIAYAYNNQTGWPTSITDTAAGSTLASYALTYDDGDNTVGNLTGVREADSTTVSWTAQRSVMPTIGDGRPPLS
jgi:hypothetical protein